MELLSTTTLLTLLVLLPIVWEACRILVWRPFMLSRFFLKQGVSGPPYKLFHGNMAEITKMKTQAKTIILDPISHDIFPRVLPHYHSWASKYGKTFLFWNGTEPRICLSDPELVKQILSNKFGFYVKPVIRPELSTLAGLGLVFVEGHDWVRRRRILNPAFSSDKLKAMAKPMADCATKVFQEWKKQIADGETQVIKIDVSTEFRRLTADVIATTAFGSSYVEGIEVFKTQKEIQKCCAASFAKPFIPGTQYLPTTSNLQMWKLERKLKKCLMKVVDAKLNSKPKNSDSYGDDLLGVMLTAAKAENSSGKKLKMSMEEIIEECQTFFFSGHETTSNLLTWTTMLLSLHQDWQEKLRDEVLKECGNSKFPDGDSLTKFKLMNMVVMEALRLYCPLIMMVRRATEDMKLGHLKIPKGISLMIPVTMIHQDKEIWGEDANEFKPMRFANGVSRAAKHPNALMAFSMGPRTCIGQNFALFEAKTVLAMVLQRFRFSLADDYKHAPADTLTLQPEFGLPVMLQPL